MSKETKIASVCSRMGEENQKYFEQIEFTWPVLSNFPLNTAPNPPLPIKDSDLKLFVANESSS